MTKPGGTGGKPWVGKLIRYGLAFFLLLWGAGWPLISVVGKRADGWVTDISVSVDSEDGRTETYTVHYRFSLPDGSVGKGFSTKSGKRYGGGVGISEGRTMTVRYVPGLPWLNAAPWDAEPIWGRLLAALMGVLIIRPPRWFVRKDEHK